MDITAGSVEGQFPAVKTHAAAVERADLAVVTQTSAVVGQAAAHMGLPAQDGKTGP